MKNIYILRVLLFMYTHTHTHIYIWILLKPVPINTPHIQLGGPVFFPRHGNADYSLSFKSVINCAILFAIH